MTFTQLQTRTALGKVPLCGCGSTTGMWTIVRDILARAAQPWPKDKPGDRKGFYDPMPEHGLSAIAVEFIAQVLSVTNHLEHGGGVGGSWLTRAGRCVLDFLREYGPDSGDLNEPIWPMWSISCSPSEQFSMDAQEWREFSLMSGEMDRPEK